WGNNSYGQLGLGDTVDRGTGWLDDPGLGDALPAVVLGDKTVTSISAGYAHSCALLEDGSVTCWGRNRYGQLGYGDTEDRWQPPLDVTTTPVAPLSVDLGGQTASEGKGAVEPPFSVGGVAASGYHSCVLLSPRASGTVLANGNVKCWGNNTYGQLGQGDTVDRGTGAATDPGMGDALAPIDLGSGVAAVAVAAGMLHTCYLLSDNSVKCCGSNTVGQ